MTVARKSRATLLIPIHIHSTKNSPVLQSFFSKYDRNPAQFFIPFFVFLMRFVLLNQSRPGVLPSGPARLSILYSHLGTLTGSGIAGPIRAAFKSFLH